MNKIIIPTGYMGSGSSAITDLISEFDGYDADMGSFEYVFLHCPSGVFDLEDKLLVGNNALRSDEALHTFLSEMKDLYDRKIWWVANYKERLSPRFLEITEQFVEELTQYESGVYWYVQQKQTPMMVLKLMARKALMLVTGGKLKIKIPLRYSTRKISFVSPSEYYDAAKRYLDSLWNEMGIAKRNLILDQLILPHNAWRMENYFGDNAECFVVDRDPRDIFLLNKYVWAKNDEVVPYPTEVEDFCKYFRRVREIEKSTENKHVHRFFFEDLVYRYDECVKEIQDILQVDADQHSRKREGFNPDKSIHNTQLFQKKEYQEEAAYIARELQEYLYDFPYDKPVELDKCF